MLPLLSAYLLAITLGLIAKDGARTATAVVLLGNWVVNTGIVYLGDNAYPWALFAVTDYLTAILLVLIRTTRWQFAVVGLYAVQLICHAAFGWTVESAWSRYYYWWSLYYTAWAQIAVFFGWWGYERVRHRLGAGRGLASAVADPLATRRQDR